MERSTLTPYLFDRTFWTDRLARLERGDRRVHVLPRPECSTEGRTVEELWLRAVDGTRLRALAVLPTFARVRIGLSVVVDERQPASLLAPTGHDAPLEWPDLDAEASRAAAGRALLLLALDQGRRLEDRVLDVLRAVDGARAANSDLAAAMERELRLEVAGAHEQGAHDTVEIARQVLAMRPR